MPIDLSHTPIAIQAREEGREQGLREGREEGREQGLREGQRDMVRRVLSSRFVDAALSGRVAEIPDALLLEAIDLAATASAGDFIAWLDQLLLVVGDRGKRTPLRHRERVAPSAQFAVGLAQSPRQRILEGRLIGKLARRCASEQRITASRLLAAPQDGLELIEDDDHRRFETLMHFGENCQPILKRARFAGAGWTVRSAASEPEAGTYASM